MFLRLIVLLCPSALWVVNPPNCVDVQSLMPDSDITTWHDRGEGMVRYLSLLGRP